jgi:hypothetical protein
LHSLRVSALLIFTLFAFPAVASAQDPAPTPPPATGGAVYGADPAVPAKIIVPGAVAQILPDGTAAAPADAPAQVQAAVWAGNDLLDKPYRYGGGHGDFVDKGYDCSGTVSYALHAAALLDSPLDSGSFMRWGLRGKGEWITVFTNPGHAYAVIAGLRLDTSSYGVSAAVARRAIGRAAAKKSAERGPRWRPTMRPHRGFRARHPEGF